MSVYPVLRSTLEGIFGAGVGYTDQTASSELLKDLLYDPFRTALQAELDTALADASTQWKSMLESCDVDYFESDTEARRFVIEHIQKPLSHCG